VLWRFRCPPIDPSRCSARWWSRERLVRALVSYKFSFPIRGATVQGVFGVAGTLTASQGFQASLPGTSACHPKADAVCIGPRLLFSAIFFRKATFNGGYTAAGSDSARRIKSDQLAFAALTAISTLQSGLASPQTSRVVAARWPLSFWSRT
jgi:hypothetical protein